MKWVKTEPGTPSYGQEGPQVRPSGRLSGFKRSVSRDLESEA